MTTTIAVPSPLLAAVERRRTQRAEERAEDERRRRAYAQTQAERERERWIAELEGCPSAVAALRLLGLKPRDAQIVPDDYHVYFDGSAHLCDGIVMNVGIVLCEAPGAAHLYMDVHFACDDREWVRVTRSVLVSGLHDTLLDAAEALLNDQEGMAIQLAAHANGVR